MDLSKGDGWLHLESFLGPERIGPFPKIKTADGPRPKQRGELFGASIGNNA